MEKKNSRFKSPKAGIQIQKEVMSNHQNSQAVKECDPKKAMVKKDVKFKVAAKKWL